MHIYYFFCLFLNINKHHHRVEAATIGLHVDRVFIAINPPVRREGGHERYTLAIPKTTLCNIHVHSCE